MIVIAVGIFLAGKQEIGYVSPGVLAPLGENFWFRFLRVWQAMEKLTLQEEKKKREERALEKHQRLSELFKEDRLSFERERRRMIDEVISSVEDEEKKKRLMAVQESWDRKMRGAGSKQNRFVLAQALFWEHFHEVWCPALEEFDRTLNDKKS